MSSIENNQYRFFTKLISGTSVRATKKKVRNKETSEFENKQVITYNDYDELDVFLRDMKSGYYSFNSEMEKNASCFSSKGEYVFYLKNKLYWIRDMIDDTFSTKRDKVTINTFNADLEAYEGELPKEKKEVEFYRPYFEVQYKYATRAVSMLKDFIETVITLKTEDIPLKTPEQLKQDAPTPDKPLAFFVDFYLRNGLWRFRKSFEPSEEDYEYMGGQISYDEKEEVKTTYHQDPETGEYDESKEYFKEELSKKLIKEYYRFIDAIDSKIDTLTKSKEEITNYLIVQLSRIREIKTGIEKNELVQKYEISNKVIFTLVKHLVEKYKHYIPVEVLHQFSDIYKSNYVIPFQKLTLKVPGKEFVALFGGLIKDNKLQYNGNSDVQPIVDALSTFFEIPKSRGQGFIMPTSLLTEFKEFMAPPANARSRK